MVKVNLKDGVVKEYNNGITVLEIAKDINEGLARNACCALVNGNVEDLRFVVNEKDFIPRQNLLSDLLLTMDSTMILTERKHSHRKSLKQLKKR